MARVRRTLVVLIVIATFAVACESGSSGEPSETTATEDRSSPPIEPDCSNQAEVIADPESVRSRRLSADVDGDGRDDTLSVAVNPDSPQGCRAFLVAATGAGSMAEEISDFDISFDLGLPTLEGVVQVGDGPGGEAVVRIVAGASTLFVGLFTVHEGRLQRIEVAGDAQFGNLFPAGGSVGHLEGSDCTQDGIVISTGVPKGRGYEVTRTFYSVMGSRAEPTGTETDFVRSRDLNRYPELAGIPFLNCAVEE
jgi:hypothetical protein